LDGYKARTEAVDAGGILVAARLVDPALTAEFGFDGNDRDAVGFASAIAASLAHQFVDEDALAGIRHLAALAAATLFGRTDLVVDQDRDALRPAKRTLGRVETGTWLDHDRRWQIGAAMALGLFRDDIDLADAFGRELARDLRHGEAAFRRLSAGHG